MQNSISALIWLCQDKVGQQYHRNPSQKPAMQSSWPKDDKWSLAQRNDTGLPLRSNKNLKGMVCNCIQFLWLNTVYNHLLLHLRLYVHCFQETQEWQKKLAIFAHCLHRVVEAEVSWCLNTAVQRQSLELHPKPNL